MAPAQPTPDRTVVRIDLLLTEPPLSNPALSTVDGPLRAAAHAAAPAGTTVLVGGTGLTALIGRAAWWPGDSRAASRPEASGTG